MKLTQASSRSTATFVSVARGRPSSRRSWLRLVRGIGLSGAALAGAGFLGCGGIGDETYVPSMPEPVNQADIQNPPWCVNTCEPDYGSQTVDCTADDGLEFFPFDVLNGTVGGLVTGFYSYTDETAEFFVAGPDGFDFNPLVVAENFEPQVVPVSDRPCDNDTEYVHHFRGGPFREWGGGIGRRLVNFAVGCPAGPAQETDPAFCPDLDERIELAAETDPNIRNQAYTMMVDVSEWEGISFWARQGPNNNAGIRVYLADRQLDEDIAYLETNAGLVPMCHRARECGCRNHRPCTANDPPVMGFSCWDPEIDPSPATLYAQAMADGTLPPGREFEPYEPCGITACNEGNPAFNDNPDRIFATPEHPTDPGTAECRAYKLTNDLLDEFCYDPEGDPEFFPPDGPDRCGDGWAKGVTLTNNWQFYKIPFTDLRQEGYGRMFSHLDLSKITLVRFTWMQGWVDVWLDDVRFYRHKAPEQTSE